MPKFSHLHVHTQYSLLDGAASIDGLYKKAIKDEMPALAITDHGNMFGAFNFVSQAWKNTKVIGKDDNGKDILAPTVKPIVGCEFYVVKDRHIKQFTKEHKDDRFHQVLLAKNAVGYQNLIKLTSLGYIEGMYSKYPRIDKELIEKYGQGMIAEMQVDLRGRTSAEVMTKLVDPELRPMNTFEVAELWRQKMPQIPGVKSPV